MPKRSAFQDIPPPPGYRESDEDGYQDIWQDATNLLDGRKRRRTAEEAVRFYNTRSYRSKMIPFIEADREARRRKWSE